MPLSTVDSIIREREIRNETRVAIARFAVLSLVVVLDVLAYFDVITFTATAPTTVTLALDALIVVYAATVLGILLRRVYVSYLKYVVVTLDFMLIAGIMAVDPTVPKEGPEMVWIAFAAPLFFYMINLTRYSKGATIYASVLSVALFAAIIVVGGATSDPNVLPISVPFLMILAIGYSITVSNREMIIEANTKRMMERYLPPQLIDELYTEHASVEPGGENRIATMLFADIRSFTAIAESLPAGEVVALLNDYLSTMTEIIFAREGTIDKFIGDGIMTTFGLPIAREDDEMRAIDTAIDMQRALTAFNDAHAAQAPPLQIGVGIHTGTVIAGNIGSDKRLDYTVIGDSVNLTSRIEGLTRNFQSPILISEATQKRLPADAGEERYLIRELGDVAVKGRTQSVRVFEVMSYFTDSERDQKQALASGFTEALRLYQSGKYGEASRRFAQFPDDGPSILYRKRCEQMEFDTTAGDQSPPPLSFLPPQGLLPAKSWTNPSIDTCHARPRSTRRRRAFPRKPRQATLLGLLHCAHRDRFRIHRQGADHQRLGK